MAVSRDSFLRLEKRSPATPQREQASGHCDAERLETLNEAAP